ncbi:MAG: endolytic transglycosylase MltG [Sandaracinaceae bacterium]
MALAGLAWLTIVYPKEPGPGSGRVFALVLEEGSEIAGVATRLEAEGALERPFLFTVYARLRGADDKLRTGEVLLTDDMTPRQLLQRVAVGLGHAAVTVTLPEGFDRFAIAERLARWEIAPERALLAATEDPALLRELGIEGPTAEGYLFPDTYTLQQDLGGPETVRRLVLNWRRRVEPLLEEHQAGLGWLETELGWGRHEVLTLASIVEKEAVVDGERPVIAGVFLNRLRFSTFRPKRLQADPTVAYGCRTAPQVATSCGAFDGRQITRAMLEDRANPYNTYRHEGLPPGPISNPGVASIRAVLDPAQHEFLYFVARGEGRHAFSETLDEHNRAVARQRDRNGR